jgi:hypothetical protein
VPLPLGAKPDWATGKHALLLLMTALLPGVERADTPLYWSWRESCAWEGRDPIDDDGEVRTRVCGSDFRVVGGELESGTARVGRPQARVLTVDEPASLDAELKRAGRAGLQSKRPYGRIAVRRGHSHVGLALAEGRGRAPELERGTPSMVGAANWHNAPVAELLGQGAVTTATLPEGKRGRRRDRRTDHAILFGRPERADCYLRIDWNRGRLSMPSIADCSLGYLTLLSYGRPRGWQYV